MSNLSVFRKPVIIVGAPRSGTSLLQKIIRENPIFVSVARESDVIWNPYIHPALNDWSQEGLVGRQLSEKDIASILNAYRSKVLPAAVWSHWSRSRFMELPLVYRSVRRVYPFADRLVTAVRKILPVRQQVSRLVDKSVHFGLWLTAIHQVFPDALFIHIARDGKDCVRSMMNGWLDPDRFNTYLIPENLREGDEKYWCFPMSEKWQEYLKLPLAERVAHQWADIQTLILEGLETPRKEGRYFYVKLEDLSGNPEKTIRSIAEYIEVPWGKYFEDISANIPVINASNKSLLLDADYTAQNEFVILDIIRDTQLKLGYAV